MSPQISVVLPTYNRADVISESIESVLDQTFEDLELLVVDDGSTDQTEEVVNEFEDERIFYVRLGENNGAAAARNAGIEEATGDYIAFQDSDDVWRERKLERQLHRIDEADEDTKLVYTQLIREGVDGKTRRVPPANASAASHSGWIFNKLQIANFISTQTVLVEKEQLVATGGFDANIAGTGLEDWELWLRLSRECRFAYIDEPLVRARIQSDSLSLQSERKTKCREFIINKHGAEFDRKPRARQLFYVGNGYMRTGSRARGIRYLFRALRTDPTLFYFGTLLLSFAGKSVYSRVMGFGKRKSGSEWPSVPPRSR